VLRQPKRSIRAWQLEIRRLLTDLWCLRHLASFSVGPRGRSA
jgi:hypothetical protein